MADYISREAAIEKVRVAADCANCSSDVGGTFCAICDIEDAVRLIKQISAADVEPVRHGRWELMDGYKTRRACAHCGWDVPEYGKFYAFCPNCGSRMDLEDEKMKIDRAIEILDPDHREHYDGMEEVNEACRMGMEALKRQKWIPCSYVPGTRLGSACLNAFGLACRPKDDDFCSRGERKDQSADVRKMEADNAQESPD